jgi:hypothetical protein
MLVYLLTISVLLLLAALIAEWMLIRWRRPARVVWSAALLLCVALPFLPSLPDPVPASAGPVESSSHPVVGRDDHPVGSTLRVWVPAFSVPRSWFYAASLAAAGLLFSGWALLLLRAGRWTRDTLDGTVVLRAPATGPAVVGFFRPLIVVPDWAFGLPPHQRRMLLAHEQSHIDARDPLLLFLSALVVVAMPWNPLLRCGLQRLRGAIEIDCDRRVLSAGEQADDYARCLVDSVVLAAGPMPAVGSLSLSSSHLERRVHLMLHPRRAFKVVSAVMALAVVALVSSAFRVVPPPATQPNHAGSVLADQALNQIEKRITTYYGRLGAGQLVQPNILYGAFREDWSVRDPNAKPVDGC